MRKRSAAEAKRSERAIKAWLKRQKKQKLLAKVIDQAGEWREISLPTHQELFDYMEWLAEIFGVEIKQMYEMYWGYEISGAEVID